MFCGTVLACGAGAWQDAWVNTYVKLYGSIIHSSIWSQPDHVRLVWITMLAMADMDGDVHASPLGIANASRQSIEQTMEALNALSSPEPYSRDGTDGVRIVKIERGYRILNHSYYRNLRTPKQVAEAERKASYRMSLGHEGTVPDVPRTSKDSVSVDESDLSGSGEEREHEREEVKPKRARKPKVDMSLFEEFWAVYDHRIGRAKAEKAWATHVGDDREFAMKVIAAAREYANNPKVKKDNREFQKHASTWLNGKHWNDEIPGAKQSIFNAPLMQPDPEDTSNVWTEEDERQNQESLRRLVSKMTPEKRAKWEAEQIAEGCEVYRGDWPPERLAAWEAERLANGQKIWRDGR